jgi:hypothetical protein
MNRTRLTLSALALFAFIVICSSPAHAQATRTWVSGVGDDVNPCSRTAPCKTFAGAISKTATCGEISVLDPGGFGAVTITKSITLNGDGTLAGILASLTNGIIVNAAASSVVVIRGISINGACNGLNGIRFIAGNTLQVENTTITGFTGFGIDINRGAAAGGFVGLKNVTITNAVSGGVNVTQGAASVRVSAAHCFFNSCNFGIKAGANSIVSARECEATACGVAGFLADGATARMNLDSCMSSNNVNGVKADNSAILRMADCTVSDNITKGVSRGGGALGTVESYSNNRIRGNPSDDAVSPFGQQ